MSETDRKQPAARNDIDTPTRPDSASQDPRETDLEVAHDVDPQSGQSDDPRVHPGGNDGRTSDERNTDDDAWQSEFTDDAMPAPEQREDASRTLKLDPT